MNRSDALTTVHAAAGALAEALNTLEARVLDLPEGDARSRYLRAVQRMAHAMELDLLAPLQLAIEDSPCLTGDEDATARDDTGDALIGSDGDPEPASAELRAEIDRCLLEACTSQWRQAARVAGMALGQWPDLPIELFARRLQGLASRGLIEAKGDLTLILHSEVRLPSDTPMA